MSQILHITSRDNPALQRLRKLSQDGNAYRKLGSVWLEGDHLARACLARGHAVTLAVLTEEACAD
ncbi:TrmH family RNA methyltransferase, partial [Roseateles sp. GG27B]